MSRAPRLILENVCYHVITRGNQRQPVFCEEIDFLKYLDLLKRYKKKYKARLYGYCLMTNHVHLILDLKDLTHLMHGLNLAYVRYFNGKYKKVGHLWQGRFKSMIVNKDKYLIDCISYIEHNPIRANIADSPLKYPWSSYKARLLGQYNGLLDQIEII